MESFSVEAITCTLLCLPQDNYNIITESEVGNIITNFVEKQNIQAQLYILSLVNSGIFPVGKYLITIFCFKILKF